jgi:hypothetical protein
MYVHETGIPSKSCDSNTWLDVTHICHTMASQQFSFIQWRSLYDNLLVGWGTCFKILSLYFSGGITESTEKLKWVQQNIGRCSNQRHSECEIWILTTELRCTFLICNKECLCVLLYPCRHIYIYIYIYTGIIYNLLACSTALRFTAAGVSLAARLIRYFPMKQHAW